MVCLGGGGAGRLKDMVFGRGQERGPHAEENIATKKRLTGNDDED